MSLLLEFIAASLLTLPLSGGLAATEAPLAKLAAAASGRAQTTSSAVAPQTGPVSGYMGFHFNQPTDGTSGVLDFHRFVLLFTHRFSDHLRFVTTSGRATAFPRRLRRLTRFGHPRYEVLWVRRQFLHDGSASTLEEAIGLVTAGRQRRFESVSPSLVQPRLVQPRAACSSRSSNLFRLVGDFDKQP